MHRCPNCDIYVPDASATCPSCAYLDCGWAEVQRSARSKPWPVKPVLAQQAPTTVYKIKLSAFSDPIELGFHMHQIMQALKPYAAVVVDVDVSALQYEWDYAQPSEDPNDLFLPPRTPIMAVADTARFIHLLERLSEAHNLRIKIRLPPKNSPVSDFLLEAQAFGISPSVQIQFAPANSLHLNAPASDEVLVPKTGIPKNGDGQLPRSFVEGLKRVLSQAKVDQEYTSDILKIIMEGADNSDTWGGGGWVSAFLRQEKRQREGLSLNLGFDPFRETHLMISLFSIGPTLAEATKHSREADAVSAVCGGFSSRSGGNGGRGIPLIVKTVTEQCSGTVVINSGSYTRIITPDGMAREWLSGGTYGLAGVHLALVIPLAEITQVGEFSVELGRERDSHVIERTNRQE